MVWCGMRLFRGCDRAVYSANNLNGSLPEVFGNLTHLQTLSMQENPLLGGFLPTSLYLAPDLEFVALFSCDFSGPIPVEAFQRPQLKSLQLGYNKLSGELSSNVDSWNASSLPSVCAAKCPDG